MYYRKKRKWDQPAESLVSAGVALPGVLPLGNVGPLVGIPLAGVAPPSSALLTNVTIPPVFQTSSIQQHASAIVQKLNQVRFMVPKCNIWISLRGTLKFHLASIKKTNGREKEKKRKIKDWWVWKFRHNFYYISFSFIVSISNKQWKLIIILIFLLPLAVFEILGGHKVLKKKGVKIYVYKFKKCYREFGDR